MNTPRFPDFERCAAVFAAVQRGDAARLRDAAGGWSAAGGNPVGLLGLLRFAHLFVGIPQVLRALNVLTEVPGALDAVVPDDSATDWRAHGEVRFREVYGEDADRVLARLAQLDPVMHDWVLEHAYGRTGAAHGLPLALAERLAVLALAATHCPDQCRSHVRAALRHGVSAERLQQDISAADWLDATQRAELAAQIARESESAR